MWQTQARRFSASSIFLITSLLFLTARSLHGTGVQAHAHDAVDYNASYLIAITGTAGLLGFAGHRHAVLATDWSADLKMNFDDLSQASAVITVPADKLIIDSPAARQKAGLGAGPSDSDVRIIQQRILSSEVLDAVRFPQIKFTSRSIKAQGNGQLQVTGKMQIHGRSHPITVQAKYRSDGQRTAVDGQFNIRQTDYGIKPESVAGGTIKVKDSITIKFHVVMTTSR